RWLVAAPRPEGEPLGGLYVGEGGVGLALLRAGPQLGDPALVDEALRRSRFVAGLPHRSPDLFNGTAGRLRFHLWTAQATGDAEALDAAVAAGRALVDRVRSDGSGAWWVLPPDLGDAPPSLGYAHGAAGIADALMALYAVTGEPALREVAGEAARWIVGQAVPIAGDGVAWPSEPGQPPAPPLWCHGAGGIARFLLHTARWSLVPDPMGWVRRALASVAAARALGPVACHGLAGSIELLVDAFQATGEEQYLAQARALGAVLETFHRPDGAGGWLCTADTPRTVSPDFTVGMAGVLGCWVRLAEPAQSRSLFPASAPR
ncbi:MAG: lanthionine synthetase LanC family protein, partial [Myxococcota bacterium]